MGEKKNKAKSILGTIAKVAGVVALGAGIVAACVAAAPVVAVAAAVGTVACAVGAVALTSKAVLHATDGEWKEAAFDIVGAAMCVVGAAQFGKMFTGAMNQIKAAGMVQPNTGTLSTGRTTPNDLYEKLAMDQVKSNPLDGATKIPIELKDARWPSTGGWTKMQNIVTTSKGDINIHFNYNEITKVFADFKFK